jgi:hypothetical protein
MSEHEQAPAHVEEIEALEPIPVHARGQAHQAGHQGLHFTTSVNTTTQPVQQLLGRDYERTEAQVLAVDEPVYLAASKELAEAAAAAGANAGIAQPGASYLPVGFDRPILNGDELWCAATSATAGRVSVIVNRRLPETRPPGP